MNKKMCKKKQLHVFKKTNKLIIKLKKLVERVEGDKNRQ